MVYHLIMPNVLIGTFPTLFLKKEKTQKGNKKHRNKLTN
jgi:hypothetical protein